LNQAVKWQLQPRNVAALVDSPQQKATEVKPLTEVVGHSLLSITADIYGHLFPQAVADAADAINRALG
jgi:hypothetical protein